MEYLKKILYVIIFILIIAETPNFLYNNKENGHVQNDTIYLEPHIEDRYLAGWNDSITFIVDTLHSEFHLEFHYKSKNIQNIKVFFKDYNGYFVEEFNSPINKSTVLISIFDYHKIKEGYVLIHNKKTYFKIKL